MGDVKLALLMGAVLGRTVSVGADGRHVRGAGARASSSSPATARRRARWGSRSAPFLALGCVVALFVGATTSLDAYLSLLH